jgi:hypothetical protein
METKTLSQLPKQPLPPLTLHSPIILTIWWATILALSWGILNNRIKKRSELRDFAGIKHGAYILNM